MRSLLFKNSFYYTLGEVLPKVLSLLLIPFYAKIFSPKDFGIISYTTSIFVFLPVFCTLCLNSYILRFYYECKNLKEQKMLIGNVFLFISIISTLVFIIGMVFFPFFLKYYKVKVPWNPYFLLGMISFYFDTFSIIPNVYLRVTQNARSFFLINFLKVVLQYLLILTFVFKFRLGLYGFYLGNLIAIFTFSFIYISVVYKKALFILNFQQISNALKFSLPLCPAAFAYLIISFSDRLLLEHYVNLNDLGIYSIAYTISFAINMFVGGLYKAIEPELFKRINSSGFELFILKASNIFYFFVFFLAALISLFSTEALTILTSKDYLPSTNYIHILIYGVVLLSMNLFLGGLLTIKKSTKILGLTNFIGVIVIIIINLIFIPIYGIYAACFSLVISYLIINLIMVYFTKDFKINSLIPFKAIFMLAILNIINFYLFNNGFSFYILLYKMVIFALYLFILKIILNLNFLDFRYLLKLKANNV